MEFNYTKFIFVIISSILPFVWIFKSKLKLIYFTPFVVFTSIYSGIGACWSKCHSDYIFFYALYLLTLGVSCYFAQRNKIVREKDHIVSEKIMDFIDRYGNLFIYLHLLFSFFPLIYPELKIANLIHPPRSDLSTAFFESFNKEPEPVLISLIYYIDNIILIFYYLALYKYKENIPKLILFLLLPFYFGYASSGYISRGGAMATICIILIVIFITYPQYRTKLIMYGMIATPFTLFGLSWYTYYRLGVNNINISFSEALNILIYSETNYPLHYAEIINMNLNLSFRYLLWIANLPLPAFAKIINADYEFNFIFSEEILGIARGTQGFNVLLPGVVNESIFLFGKSFFFVHAIIYGFIIGKVYKILKYKTELLIFIYFSFVGAFTISRGGTVSMYPFYFKHFVIFLIVIFVISRYKVKIGNYKLN